MMRTLVVEDEKLSAQRLAKMVTLADPSITVEALAGSVREAVEWLSANRAPDFMLLDIQLGDGLSFDILEITGLKCPVIFTTAYNEYAVKAFRLNSVDYLLKPVDPDELAEALQRVKQKVAPSNPLPDTFELAKALRQMTRTYKERFLIRVADRIHILPVARVSAFVSMEGATFAASREGRLYDIDLTLEQLSQVLNPDRFFRISRKYIVAVDAVESVTVYSGSRLKLHIEGVKTDEVLVSRERVGEFREWMDR
jgi:DNA-binding LytR/AlgR family response regulator